MTNCLQGLKKNGASRHVHLVAWLHAKPTVEKEILVLSVLPKKTPKRKRVSLDWQLLTHDKLEETAAASAKKTKATKPRSAESEGLQAVGFPVACTFLSAPNWESDDNFISFFRRPELAQCTLQRLHTVCQSVKRTLS
ncbi:hypothetical protein PC123_g11850 [Phytophthora cactorum]|nr:hypothetical protein PC123_g11850 [Phytophthora cactorum]